MVEQVICRSLFIHHRNLSWNPLLPLSHAYAYKLGCFFYQTKTSIQQIGQFYQDDLLLMNTSPTLQTEYESGYT